MIGFKLNGDNAMDENLLNFTDIYIVLDDYRQSYCYYKGTDTPETVNEKLLPHIENMINAYQIKKIKLSNKDYSGNIEEKIFEGLEIEDFLRKELSANTSLDKTKIDYLCDKVSLFPYIREKITDNLKKVNISKTENTFKDVSFTYLDRNFRSYTIEGLYTNILVCRQNFSKNISLSTSGLHPTIYNELLAPELSKGGLILLCGTNGSGKSTTCAALIKERLSKHKGFCMTVEDPIEIPIEGKHGDGVCLQVQINPHEGFAPKIRELMRAYPTGQNLLLLIGEIRDSDTAVQVLKAAIDGRLVVSTIHADTVEAALKRLLIMAAEKMSFEAATDLLSDSFRICLHQSLLNGTLKTKFLKGNSTVAGIIKNGDIDKLNSEIERQEIAINKNIKFEYLYYIIY
jgi:twitching motility protein PilT